MKQMQISEWKPVKGNVIKGSFVVTTPSGMKISCTLCEKDDGTKWVNPPQRTITTGDKTRYEKLVTFVDKATSDRFNAAVLAALDAYFTGSHR